MKTTCLSLLALLCLNVSFSQVGIGTTTPHPSSILDIYSTDKGLLVPRMDLGNLNTAYPVSNPEKSMLVWNTDASNGGADEGFYFWNGSSWLSLKQGTSVGPSGNAWSFNGNAISGSDFIGTISHHAFNVRVNNHQVSSYHPNGSVAIGKNANAQSNEATALGVHATASGYRSAVLGYNATASNNEAIALGVNATASGHQSAALGYNARAITSNSTLALGNSATASSFQSTAIGVNANANTHNNTLAIGANSTASGENSTAIGQGAVANQPNTLILGNTASGWNATKVGIGTSNPTEKLHVNGSVRIVDGSQGAGKVLTSDANGRASWQEITVSGGADIKRYAEIYKTSSAIALNQYNPITFGVTGFAEGVTANNDNFQVPVAGVYRVSYTVTLQRVNVQGGPNAQVKFYMATSWSAADIVPGSSTYTSISNGQTITVSTTKLVQLNAWQQLYLFTDTSNNGILVQPGGTNFNIELVRAL